MHRLEEFFASANFHSLIGPAVTAAVISALVTIVGYRFAYQITRRLDSDHRREKTIDFLAAVLAEIRSNLDRYRGLDLAEHLAQMLVKIEPTDLTAGISSNYTPFVPKDASTLVFDEIVREIYVLPTSSIDAVVRYYKGEHYILNLIGDMRDPEFKGRAQSAKAAMYTDYITQIGDTHELGKVAMTKVESA